MLSLASQRCPLATACPRQHRPAWSLLELLVVVGIIALLVGLMLPAVQAVRQSANQIQCASNLRQIGLAFQMYRDNHQGQFPVAARVPSVTPHLPGLGQVLEQYTEGRRIFRCPSDQTYFLTEGLSYEYAGELRSGVTLEFLQAQGRSSTRIWMLHDFEAVHSGNRNFLYADGHVTP